MKSHEKPGPGVENPHALTADNILDELNSTLEGLSDQDATERLRAYGPNRLPDARKDGFLKKFFKHFHDLLIYILIVAAVVTALLHHWVDTGVILAVVVINAIIGCIQEGKAERALEGIRKMLSLHAQTRRDGEWVEIEAEKVAPGDIIRLGSGDRVPADIRLLDANNLRIEESALTGESVAAEKKTDPVDMDAGVGDRFCMAHSGTMVLSGRGVGVVTATGSHTEIGRINKMIGEVQKPTTPLTRRMNRFGKILSLAILALATFIWILGWLHGMPIGERFLSAIGFAVAAIPEGLPAILTITLALGVQRMAQRNAITRKLNAVETLGSVTVICSDKTGTLTRNEMTACQVVTPTDRYDVEGTGYAPEGKITHNGQDVPLREHTGLHQLIEIMALCNDSGITEKNGGWRVRGEPTEGALITLALKGEFDFEGYQRVAEIPFESENKYMATLNSMADGSRRIFMKGAPDRLLNICAHQHSTGNSTQVLDKKFWEETIEELGNRGLRVLAAATREVSPEKDALTVDDLEQDMVFVGLVGIIDPPRPEAIEAIKVCHRAGIRVKMITGDHLGTAGAIGAEMGIGSGADAVSGVELENISDEELSRVACENNIFARTNPEHKLRLVQALQANGEVVAMTGDGVNDAPALKRADVGIAMGVKGTEATKEAADIVLADDNFTSIEHAVEEGRKIYDNLRKAILFILPTNGAEALIIFVAVLSGWVLPLTPVQILWVNMVTAVTLAVAFAFEPAEPGVMDRPPREPDAPIIGIALLWRIFFVSLLIGGASIAVFAIEKHVLGLPLEHARTLAVNTLVFGQTFYLFNSRYMHESSLSVKRLLSNRVALLATGMIVLLQLLFVYTPLMHILFDSTPLALRHWLVPLGIGAGAFVLIEGEKKVTRHFLNSDGNKHLEH